MKKLGFVKWIVMVAILGCSVISLCGCTKTINLDKYFTYHIEGEFSGSASIVDEMDTSGLYEALVKAINEKDEFLRKSKAAFALDFISGAWDKPYGLKNGDTVTYKWTINNEALKELGIKFNAKDVKVKVKDLMEVPTFDPFKHINVTYSGINSEGVVIISSDNTAEMEYVKFRWEAANPDPSKLITFLKNGDKVYVRAELDTSSISENEFYQKFNKIVITERKEYEVHGLMKHINSENDITQTTIDQMDAKLREGFKKELSKICKNMDRVSEPELMEAWFGKDNSEGYKYYTDTVFFIYKIKCADTEVFWYGSFNDALLNEDGTLVPDSTYDCCKIYTLLFGYLGDAVRVEDGVEIPGYLTYDEALSHNVFLSDPNCTNAKLTLTNK